MQNIAIIVGQHIAPFRLNAPPLKTPIVLPAHYNSHFCWLSSLIFFTNQFLEKFLPVKKNIRLAQILNKLEQFEYNGNLESSVLKIIEKFNLRHGGNMNFSGFIWSIFSLEDILLVDLSKFMDFWLTALLV